MPTITINNQKIEAKEGQTILEVAKDHHIDIPTLCHFPDLDVQSDCRICMSEIVGQKKLAPSCSTPVKEGMEIKTNSQRVYNARKTITELLLSNHDTNCTACERNMNCELQTLADTLGIDENRFENILEHEPIDDNNPSITRNADRCIKCGRCIEVCKNVQGIHVLDYMNRSHDTKVAPAHGKFLNDQVCTYCGQCANVCPVASITEKSDLEKVTHAIHDETKHVIVQTAPATRVSLGETLGMDSGSIVTGQMVAALRRVGFDKVFDTDFTADLTIMEEGHELLSRVKEGGKLPMITSCCPGWVNYAEQKNPDMLDHLSTAKSPQQMFGALAKTYYAEKEHIDPNNVYVVSIMPCTAKKFEAAREEMQVHKETADVDAVLTTRELGKMIKRAGVNFKNIGEESYDAPFGITSGAGAIFGATGGVMEAALRTVSEVVNEKPLEKLDFEDIRGMEGIKEASVTLGENTFKVAVAHTLSNAQKVLDDIKAGVSPYAFIEVMACPGGCIGGGGQPYTTTNAKRQERIDAIYNVDTAMKLRKSHENPAVNTLYEEYLSEPLSKRAHDLLHTHYKPR